MRDLDRRDRLLARADALEPVAVMILALVEVDLVRPITEVMIFGSLAASARASFSFERRIARRSRVSLPRDTKIQPSLPMNLMPFGKSPLTIMCTPLA